MAKGIHLLSHTNDQPCRAALPRLLCQPFVILNYQLRFHSQIPYPNCLSNFQLATIDSDPAPRRRAAWLALRVYASARVGMDDLDELIDGDLSWLPSASEDSELDDDASATASATEEYMAMNIWTCHLVTGMNDDERGSGGSLLAILSHTPCTRSSGTGTFLYWNSLTRCSRRDRIIMRR